MPIFLADYISIVRSQLNPKVNGWITDVEIAISYFDEVPVEGFLQWVKQNIKHT